MTEADFFRIVAMAIGSVKYVEQMAEKNILKMVEMAKQGWAGTGNAPFGTDLVCYPIHDLNRPLFRVVRTRYMRPHQYRIVHYAPDSRVDRDPTGLVTAARLTVSKVEETERMPLRDKKGTGYRFEPSVEADRLAAVRQMYELYDVGLGFTEISRRLWEQGYKHYDKEFLFHGVETILSNPVYTGEPAWGKNGVGAYRILHQGNPVRIRRKATDPFVIRKGEEQYVRPLHPLFPPIVPLDLWWRVHDRLTALQSEDWLKNCQLTQAMAAVFEVMTRGNSEMAPELFAPADPEVLRESQDHPLDPLDEFLRFLLALGEQEDGGAGLAEDREPDDVGEYQGGDAELPTLEETDEPLGGEALQDFRLCRPEVEGDFLAVLLIQDANVVPDEVVGVDAAGDDLFDGLLDCGDHHRQRRRD